MNKNIETLMLLQRQDFVEGVGLIRREVATDSFARYL